MEVAEENNIRFQWSLAVRLSTGNEARKCPRLLATTFTPFFARQPAATKPNFHTFAFCGSVRTRIRDGKITWQSETWQDRNRTSFSTFSGDSLVKYTDKLEKRAKIQWRKSEKIPQNCRFLSLVVVECVLNNDNNNHNHDADLGFGPPPPNWKKA